MLRPLSRLVLSQTRILYRRRGVPLSRFLRLFIYASRRRGTVVPTRRYRPLVETLEDRSVPSGLTSISGNFNGTTIPAGDTLWFSSVAKVQGLGSAPVTIGITNQSISFVAQGVTYDLKVPSATLTLTPTATTASTTFAGGAWITSSPTHFSGNVFVSGLSFPVPNGLPGGIHNVTWQMQVATDTAGVNMNWQWAAAVYSSFSADESALGIKPVDDNHLGSYQNSDHAGTPENYKAFVVGGGTGGGGSNWTGSLSATASVTPTLVTPSSSLAGSVFIVGTSTGQSGVLVTLSGVNALGQAVSVTASTHTSGAYHFNSLLPGTYVLTEQPTAGYTDSQNSAGTAGGTSSPSSNQITGITLNPGINALNYNFGNFLAGSGGGGGGS
jgi:hypothetical protein